MMPAARMLRAAWLPLSLAAALAPPLRAQQAQRAEQEHLARARQGIERHRKGDATLVFVDRQGRPRRGLRRLRWPQGCRH